MLYAKDQSVDMIFKGPSQKFAEAQSSEQNSFGSVGVFEKIAL